MALDAETGGGKTSGQATGTLAPEEANVARGEQDAGLDVDRRGRTQRKPHRLAIFIVAVIGIGVAVFFLWRHYAQWVSTDDAEIEGYIYPISARVSGHVVKVTVENTQYVDKGTVLAELDPTDYQVAVDSARAQLANAQAAAQGARVGVPITSINTLTQVNTAQADVDSAQSGITAAERQFQAAQAKLREAEANDVIAQDNVKRYGQLVGKNEVSRQQYDDAVAIAKGSAATVAAAEATAAAAEQQVVQARNKLLQAQAGLQSAQTRPQQLRVIRARAAAAVAAVEAAEASLHKAELNLQYTTIVAPVNGVVGKRTVVVGENVQIAQALMAIVPIDNLWVTADFKETQLRDMRVGQPATIHVDAYDRDYKGYVDGIAGATGVQFSLLPPENATGNYVKVVQRLPVRLLFDKGQDPQRLLRVGMSVEPHVKVN
ncbi:MAG TPA: HlyD family secretion protein [Terriglobia bacterium]|nr:HlyD family secretion protein [Terriglobia bacterium]